MSQPLIMPFTNVAAYADAAGLASRTVFGAERVDCGEARHAPAEDRAYFDHDPAGYDFPAIQVTPIRDVVVRSMSNILTTPDAILRHDLMNVVTDQTPEGFFGRLATGEAGRIAGWTKHDPFDVHYVSEAAAFTDGASFNYAHWLTEILPRIAVLLDEKGVSPVPLLLDQRLHKNVRRSLDMIAPKVTTYQLQPDHVARVRDLHYVSATGYVPFRLRPQPLEQVDHGVFGRQALTNAISRLQRAARMKRMASRPRLFVRRTSRVRRLLNEAEIEQALANQGFQPITPETLPLEEQISLFSQAEIVVGATGAGMVNLAFSAADCPTVVMMPRFKHTAYWYWRRIAAAAGSGPVVHVSGPQAAVLDDPFNGMALQQDYAVAVKDVLDGVEQALALRA